MARDEARHGKAFEGLLKRCFGKQELLIPKKDGLLSILFVVFWRPTFSAGFRKTTKPVKLTGSARLGDLYVGVEDFHAVCVEQQP